MSHREKKLTKNKLRELELDTISSTKIIEDIEEVDAAINESIYYSENYIDSLINNKIPYINSKQFLETKNLDISKISIDGFFTNNEIVEIEKKLNRPLIKRAKWDNWDYSFVFITAMLGVIIDTLVGNPKKGVSAICSDKNSFIGEWFEKIHSLHSKNSPMDYQGLKMGGGGHRLRSIGHDLLGFPFGIWQIMNGTFTGGYYHNGKYESIILKINQYGNPYESHTFMEALLTYIGHVFCDFFSSYSIPIPGFGILAKLPARDIRIFAADMYNNGYNLRHVFIQGFSVLFIETMIRTYSYFRLKKVQGLKEEPYLQKRRELLLLAHSIVAGFNIGKVAITGNIISLNLPQILAVVFHFLPVMIFHSRNNNQTKKIIRNISELKENQFLLENEIASDMLKSAVFKDFLNSQPFELKI